MTAHRNLDRAPNRPAPGNLLDDRRGSILVELAFALPVLLLILLGCIDTARYILLHQKMDRAAATLADLVTRPETISQAEINAMFSAATQVMEPFSLGERGRVIVSSVTKAVDEAPRVDWQHNGGGGYSATSEVGIAGGNATLPTGFVMNDGENLIVAEVFFDYEPLFMDYVLEASVVNHTALRRPRRGSLSTLE